MNNQITEKAEEIIFTDNHTPYIKDVYLYRIYRGFDYLEIKRVVNGESRGIIRGHFVANKEEAKKLVEEKPWLENPAFKTSSDPKN